MTFSFHYELDMDFLWNPKDSHNRYDLYIALWNRTQFFQLLAFSFDPFKSCESPISRLYDCDKEYVFYISINTDTDQVFLTLFINYFIRLLRHIYFLELFLFLCTIQMTNKKSLVFAFFCTTWMLLSKSKSQLDFKNLQKQKFVLHLFCLFKKK